MPDLHYVHLESSTACNAKCKMCPHSQLSRHGAMDYDLFVSIVDQAVDLGCRTFTLFRLGEPLLFPHLFRWMDYLREQCCHVSIYTNGSNLTPEMSYRLKEYRDLYCDFTISFHGYDEESYRSMMGLDFNKVRSRIIDFMATDPLPVAIYMAADDPGDKVIAEQFHALWDGVGFAGVGIARFMEWAGNIQGFRTIRTLREEGVPTKTVPCIRILNEIDVMCDGTVCLCCLDAHGEITFGNLNHVRLEQILEHKLRKYYQDKHLDGEAGELPLCRDCSTSMVVLEGDV